MNPEAPIGVFDSGLGGLTVWRELRRQLPHESLLYFGDGKNCPYGPRPAEEVRGYVESAVRQLLGAGVKMIVLACNAASAVAAEHLRALYPEVRIVAMEPAVKPAVLTTRSGVVGVLATAAALGGDLFRNTSAAWADRAEIIPVVGEGFVELVEAGREDTPEAEAAVRRAVEDMLDRGADRIVLGCTHYPFLLGTLRRVIGEREVEIIDPAPAVARHVARLLTEQGLAAPEGHVPEYGFLTAAESDYARYLAARAKQLCEAF